MSSILAGLDNQILFEQQTYKLWESAGHKIMEAQLTADQIKQLFANVEQGATAAGGNRTLIGKGKDAAGAVSKAWEDLKGKVYNSGPMNNFAAAYDKQAEKLKQATGGDQGVFKYVQKYRDFAEKHPIIQGFVYSALIAAAGVTGAGLGGAAVLGLFKLTDQLLQGKDIRSAIYQGAKTGALAYGASKLGDLIRGDKAPGAGGGDAASAAAGNLGPREVAKGAFDIVKDKIQKGEVTDWNSYQQAVNSALEQAAVQGGKEASRMSQDIARKTLDMYLNRYALDASGSFAGSGPEKIEKIITALGGQVDAEKMAMAHRAVAAMKGANESVELNEATIKILFSKVSLEHSKRIDEGIMDTLKGAAGKAMDYAKTKGHNLTTKITADKLNTAWEKAGKPTDSDQIATILKSNGVPEDVVKNVFAQMKIPVAVAPAAGQQPAQGAAQPAQQPAAQQPAAQQPAQKPGKPVIKQPSVANNRTAGVRQQGGTFAYNPLAEDAEKVAQLEAAMKQAQQITRAIKYDDSTTEIIVKIQELAAKNGIDPKSVKYAISDVYEAKSALESAVYGLDELFKDAWQDAKWKHDDEEEGLVEEKPKTAKALIYQTDVYGAKGYYGQCKESGCDFKTKSYDRPQQAQAAIKKHHQEHFKQGMAEAMPMSSLTSRYVDDPKNPAFATKQPTNKDPLDSLEGIVALRKTDPMRAFRALQNYGFNNPKDPMIGAASKKGSEVKQELLQKAGITDPRPWDITDEMQTVIQNAIFDYIEKNLKQGVAETHSTGTTIGSAGIGGGSGLGISKSPIEKVLERPFGESSIMKGLQTERKIDEYDIDGSKRIITYSKENPPPMDRLFAKFVEVLKNPENKRKIDDVVKMFNDAYGLNHTLKDYKKFSLNNAYSQSAYSDAIGTAIKQGL